MLVRWDHHPISGFLHLSFKKPPQQIGPKSKKKNVNPDFGLYSISNGLYFWIWVQFGIGLYLGVIGLPVLDYIQYPMTMTSKNIIGDPLYPDVRLVGGIPTPLKHMKVTRDDYSILFPYIMENKIHA